MHLDIDYSRMLAYDRWANGEALASLESLPSPPEAAVLLLAHLIGAQAVWLDRLTAGRDPEDWERWDGMDLAGVRRAWEQEVPRRWEAFLADPAASDPARTASYVNFLGRTQDCRVGDALVQLLLHSAYHRGQVAAAVRASGGTPAVTDFLHALRTLGPGLTPDGLAPGSPGA